MGKKADAVLKVTRVEDLKPKIVELPGWEPGEPFYARLKRVSLLNLIETGAVPNELLKIAHKIVTTSNGGKRYNPVVDSTPEELVQFSKLLHNVARAALVEPTYQELVDNDIYLTDMQLSAIYQYCQQGVQALSLFRERSEAPVTPRGDGEGVREGAE